MVESQPRQGKALNKRVRTLKITQVRQFTATVTNVLPGLAIVQTTYIEPSVKIVSQVFARVLLDTDKENWYDGAILICFFFLSIEL